MADHAPVQADCSFHPASLLDDVALDAAWAMPASMALQELALALEPADRAILSHLRGGAHSVSEELVRFAHRVEIPEIPEGVSKVLPVSVALLEWARLAPGPALTSLTAILVNAALGPEGRDPAQRPRVKELARYVRVALQNPGAPLRAMLAGASSVTTLLQHLHSEHANAGLHQTFSRLWENWMQHRVVRWILAEPSRLSQTLGSAPDLVIDISAPEIPVFGGHVEAGDDQVELTSAEVSGAPFAGLGARSVHALATAHRLLRMSGDPGLALAPDQVVPNGLIQIAARKALHAGQAALDAGDPAQAEPFLALAFAIATGAREIDLSRIVWAEEHQDGDAAIDCISPVLSLRLKRPSQARVPPETLLPCLKPSAEFIHWPLPKALHEALKGLRGELQKTSGTQVFPVASDAWSPYRLRVALSQALPGAQFGPGLFRQVLATHVAERFGPELAQFILRDSFSTTLGPAYYSWVPEGLVMAQVAQLQASWFGEPVQVDSARTHGIGSRIALKDQVARQWPARLAREAYSSARKKGGWRSHLVASRNHLAAALCAVTAVRPGRCIGDLLLDSVIPEYGLVILEDKQIDVLRRTRVAATGRRWTSALREYLQRISELAHHDDQSVAKWADGVLRSEQPLFSVPTDAGTIEKLAMETLRATMPASLDEVDNHYRHRLNQRLQEKGIDWELRHAQLGWVVSPSYALADLSPLSARSFAEQVGPVIDELAVDEGWYTQRQRTPAWSWEGVPDRPMKDWDAEIRRYENEHDGYVRGVRETFNARRSDAERKALPRLAKAIAEFMPALRVDLDQRALVRAPGYSSSGPVPLTMEHYALVRDRVRMDDAVPASAVECLAVEYLMHRLVMQAIKGRIVSGPEPPRRHLGVTAQLSPFVPGIGLAVRHAEAIRIRLAELVAEDRPHDRPGIVQLSVLAGTPFRNLDAAASVTGAAPLAIRAASQSEWLRVPAKLGGQEVPVALAGVGAAMLARRGKESPTAKPLPPQQLAEWFYKRFDGAVDGGADPSSWIERATGALRTSGRIELSGPERLIMDGHPMATVNAQRAIVVVDNWPLRTGVDFEEDASHPGPVKEAPPSSGQQAQKVDRRAYRQLTAALNPTVSRRQAQKKSDGKRAWRSDLSKELERLIKEVGADSNLGLIIQFFAHRVVYGGRNKQKLSQWNLHKELTRFGSALLDVLGHRSLREQTADDLQSIYMAVLCTKRASTRPDVIEEVQKFQRYIEKAHHVPEVDFVPLRAFSGPRIRTSDAGALSDVEVSSVLVELLKDLANEAARVDAGPEDARACALRLLLYLILEASGIRPGSAHGLVLGDVHLLGPGSDFVHVHRSGDYGEAKTTTSVGFVRLQGDLWSSNRGWIVDWVEKERAISGEEWWKLPLFAESPGSRRRFARRYLTGRIDLLLKWASDQPRARTYWLRKRRVTARLGEAMNGPRPSARDVYRALRESGHADILTPLMHYVYDAAVPMSHYLQRAASPDRAAVLASTGLSASPLDAAWHRDRRAGCNSFYGVVLDRLGVEVAAKASECLTDPPVLYRQRPLTPRHIDTFAREYRRHGDKLEAMAISGLSSTQVELLESEIKDLIVRNGFTPWQIEGIRQRRGVMAPARSLEGTTELFSLLESPPSDGLILLADLWGAQGYVRRLHGDRVLLVLGSDKLRIAAEGLLAATRVELEIEPMSDGKYTLSARRDEKGKGSPHGVGLRWVLAMIWLYRRLGQGEVAQARAPSAE